MHVANSVAAAGGALGMLMVPQDSDAPSLGIGPFGTQATCSLQGTLMNLGSVAALGWDIALSILYVLILRFKWTDSQLAAKEKWFHLIIWVFACFCGLGPLFQGAYNNTGGFCWIASKPRFCGEGTGVQCERGENYRLWQLFASAATLLALMASIVGMILIYLQIRVLEANNRRYMGASSDTTNNRSMSKGFAVEALLYVSTAFVSYLPLILVIGVTVAGFDGVGADVLYHFAACFFPLHGLFYVLLYMRNRPIMATNYGQWVRYILYWEFMRPCGLRQRKEDTAENGRKRDRSSATQSTAFQNDTAFLQPNPGRKDGKLAKPPDPPLRVAVGGIPETHEESIDIAAENECIGLGQEREQGIP